MLTSAGFDVERGAYYSKSEDGLWVRSLWNHERGVIEVAWQERTVIVDGKTHWLDENGETIRIEPFVSSQFPEDPWVLAGEIPLDRPGMIEFSNKGMRKVIESIMCHTSKLIALGFGENAAQVAEWFSRPEDGLFIIASEYRIQEGIGMFHGVDGLIFTVSDLKDEELSGVISVGDHESFELKQRLEPGTLREFLVSTIPV